MTILKPPALAPGDRLALVAPASPFDRDEFTKGIEEIVRLGFEPVFDESVFTRDGYVAGEARVRAEAFLEAWRDPSVRAIMAVRGGYGSVQVLPWLAPDELRKTPKPCVGYSDVTSLLTHLSLACGIVGFHGPMLDRRLSRGAAGYDGRSLWDSLTRAEPLGAYEGLSLEVLRAGEAVGPVYGGNLAQLTASLGTPFAFRPPSPYLLFLEDIGERPYRLDRMLTQLQLAGVLEGARGVLLGEFPGCDEPDGGPSARDTLVRLLGSFPGPVVFGFPSGHTAGPPVTLPLGVRARLVAGAETRVIIEEAAVQ